MSQIEWKFDEKVLEAAAQAMLEYESCNLARLHSIEGSIEYWREFAQIAMSAGMNEATK